MKTTMDHFNVVLLVGQKRNFDGLVKLDASTTCSTTHYFLILDDSKFSCFLPRYCYGLNGILWTYFCSDCSRQIKFWLVHDKQFSLYTSNLHLVLIPIVVFTFNRPVKIWCFTVQVNEFEIWNSLIVFFCICGNIRMFRYIPPNWWTLSMHWEFYRTKVNFEPNSWAPSKTAQNTFMQSFVLIDFNSLLNFTRIELSVDNEPVNCAPSNINQREMKWKWSGLPLVRCLL